MEISILRISERERDACLTCGCNPPPISETFSREDFLDEWDDARTAVKTALETHWTSGLDEEADFYMTSEFPEDRIVFVEISTLNMLDDRLVPLIHRAVASLPATYIVAACNDMVYLRTETGEPFPRFDLFIEPSRVRVYSESDATLERLAIAKN